MKKLIRAIHPETRIIDEAKGLVDYVASDETVDSYREVIRAKGWRFTNFSKNAPFVDSHDYWSIDKLLGRVVDFRLEGTRLIERVQWAVEVPENPLVRIGWRMTVGGFLKAVSVGFFPIRHVNRFNPKQATEYSQQLEELGLDYENGPRVIYLEQEQVELSSVILGANPNALARAYKADAITEEDLENISKISPAPAPHDEPARRSSHPEHERRAKARASFWSQLESALYTIS